MPSAPRGKKAQHRYQRSASDIDYKSSFEETESLFYLIKENGWATVTLAVTLIIVYIFTAIESSDLFITSNSVISQWGQDNNLVVNGQVWRLFTSIFVHANIIHLGGNLLFLFIFSWRLEELKGWKHVFIIFIIAGLGGNLLTLGLVFISQVDFLSVGASGAVEGMFGANITILFMSRQYPRGPLAFLSVMVIFFLLTISKDTNFIAHFGGLITGIAYIYIINKYQIDF
ncbi:MAG: rhomboid family intramembrane serine protease [Candidatus Thorarchaeota archaeon]